MSRLGLCFLASVALVCSLVADIHLDEDLAGEWGLVAGALIGACALAFWLVEDGSS